MSSIISCIPFHLIESTASQIHHESLTAAQVLELLDKKYYGEENISVEDGRRWASVGDQKISLGPSHDHLLRRQALELKMKISDLANDILSYKNTSYLFFKEGLCSIPAMARNTPSNNSNHDATVPFMISVNTEECRLVLKDLELSGCKVDGNEDQKRINAAVDAAAKKLFNSAVNFNKRP